MSKKVQNRLKELREEYHYTLDDIERNTGIKRGTYNNYENGKTEPKLETWEKLAKFYHVSVPYLQGISDFNLDVNFKTLNEKDVLEQLKKNADIDDETWKKLNSPINIYTEVKFDTKFEQTVDEIINLILFEKNGNEDAKRKLDLIRKIVNTNSKESKPMSSGVKGANSVSSLIASSTGNHLSSLVSGSKGASTKNSFSALASKMPSGIKVSTTRNSLSKLASKMPKISVSANSISNNALKLLTTNKKIHLVKNNKIVFQKSKK